MRRSARKIKAPAKFEAGAASANELGDGTPAALVFKTPGPRRAAKTPASKRSTARKPASTKKSPARSSARSKTPPRRSTARKPAKVEEIEEEDEEDDEDDEDHEEEDNDEEDDDEDDDEEDEEEEDEQLVMLQDESNELPTPPYLMTANTAVGAMAFVGGLNYYLTSDAAKDLGASKPYVMALTFGVGCLLLTNMLRTLMLTIDWSKMIFGTTDPKHGMAGVGMMICAAIVAYTNITIVALGGPNEYFTKTFGAGGVPSSEIEDCSAIEDEAAKKACDEANAAKTSESMNEMSMSKGEQVAAHVFVCLFAIVAILAVIYMIVQGDNFEDFTFSKPADQAAEDAAAAAADDFDEDEDEEDEEEDEDEEEEEDEDEE